jgi:SPP1 gp7 family putative phage head morphogenesis protein
VPDDPRTPAFWQQAEGDLWANINAVIMEAYMAGSDGGVNVLPGNIKPLINFDVVNSNALKFARNYRYTWIKDITDTTRKLTQQAIGDWIQSGAPLDALDTALTPIYGENRASVIAATETTRAFSQGNMDSWESTGVVDSATWMTANDELVCPICADYDGTEVGIGDINSTPPDASHPNCRCWLQPNVSEDLVQAKLDKIFS